MSEAINWGDLVKDAKAATEAIPVGTYTVNVIETESRKAAKSGAPMVMVGFAIESGPHKGRKLRTFHSIGSSSQKEENRAISQRMFFQSMKAYGLDAAFFESLPSLEGVEPEDIMIPVAEKLMELAPRVDVKVVHEPYQGEMRANVSGVPKAATGIAPSPSGTPDMSGIKEFAPPTPKVTTPTPNIPSAF